MASPRVWPGNGTPCNVAAFNCWKVGSPFGCTLVVTLATVASETKRAGAGAQLIAGQPIRGEPEFPRRLRDDLIAAAIEAETVDIIAAEQGGERGANILHVNAETVGFVRVDLEIDLRHIEFEIAVGEKKQAAVAGRFLDLGHDIRELAVIADGADHELQRRPARRARQRRRPEGQNLGSGHIARVLAAAPP